jgi:hypothetical protein
MWPFDDVRQDVRYALRALQRSPGFAAVAILTLALGIGANTAIFSVVNAAVLRPIPYREPASLVLIETSPEDRAPSWLTTAWRERARTLSDFAGFNGPSAATLVASVEPGQVQSALITWNFLSLLGVAPTAGRDFVETDAAPGAPPVALLSHALWMTRFGGDASVIGRTVRVSGDAVTVVRVTPSTFRFPAMATLTPASLALDTQPGVLRVAGPRTPLNVIGRLARGTAAPAARQELLAIYKQVAASLLDDGQPEYSPSAVDRLQLEAAPLQERLAGNVRERLWLAMEESIARSQEGTGSVAEVATAIRGITESVAKVRGIVDEVRDASQQQTQGIDQVAQAIAQIEKVTQTTAASAGESAAASQEMNAQAETSMAAVRALEKLVGSRGSAAPSAGREKPTRTRRPAQGLVVKAGGRTSRTAEDELPMGDTGTFGKF